MRPGKGKALFRIQGQGSLFHPHTLTPSRFETAKDFTMQTLRVINTVHVLLRCPLWGSKSFECM